MANIPVSLQLFTVRDDIDADFRGTLERVAGIGYKGVELAGNTGGLSAAELKSLLDGLGLAVTGSHVPIEVIATDVQPAIDFALEVGNKWIVCPYLSEDWRKDAAGWRSLAKILENAGTRCKQAGLQMCYHNHAFEFEKFDGHYGLDILYSSSSPDLVQAELDTYWVKLGGEEPVDYIRKYKGRVPLVHLKDMANDAERSFAEVGEGTLDIRAISDAAQDAGTQWLIVEQDECKRPPLESAQISLRNLKSMGLA